MVVRLVVLWIMALLHGVLFGLFRQCFCNGNRVRVGESYVGFTILFLMLFGKCLVGVLRVCCGMAAVFLCPAGIHEGWYLHVQSMSYCCEVIAFM